MVDTDVEGMLAKFGVTGMVAAILMIIFGVLVIVFPNLIAWIIGLYLIIVGAVNLLGHIQVQQAPPRKGVGKPVSRTR